MQRLDRAEEVAKTALSMASDNSTSMTGVFYIYFISQLYIPIVKEISCNIYC